MQERLAQAREEQGDLEQWEQTRKPDKQTWSELTADQIRRQLQLRGVDMPPNMKKVKKPALVELITQVAGPEVVVLNPDDVVAPAALPHHPEVLGLTDAEVEHAGSLAPAAAPGEQGMPEYGMAEQGTAEQMPSDVTDLSSYK